MEVAHSIKNSLNFDRRLFCTIAAVARYSRASKSEKDIDYLKDPGRKKDGQRLTGKRCAWRHGGSG